MFAYDAGVAYFRHSVRGGAFSLDGVHLTPRGYALVANRIIEAVNAKYNAAVPTVNIGYYGTVTPSNDVQEIILNKFIKTPGLSRRFSFKRLS